MFINYIKFVLIPDEVAIYKCNLHENQLILLIVGCCLVTD